ncbi:MAG: phosphohistidine phosphatase SixA [Bdellovibrionota bacterium]
MRIYLFRHGIAADPGVFSKDSDRPLTEEGMKKTRQAAEGLKTLGIRPGAFFSSPYLRARQTAEIAAAVLDFPKKKILELAPLMPHGEPEDVLAELSKTSEEEILCAGHAPNLDRVLARAVGKTGGSFTELKKAGCACIEKEKSFPGRLLWLLEAGTLRELAR